MFCSPPRLRTLSVLCFHSPNVILPPVPWSREATCRTRAAATIICSQYCYWTTSLLTPHMPLDDVISLAGPSLLLLECSSLPVILLARVPLPKLFNLAGNKHLHSTAVQCTQCTVIQARYIKHRPVLQIKWVGQLPFWNRKLHKVWSTSSDELSGFLGRELTPPTI